MKRFEYAEPATLEEAIALLSRYNGEASILAGGTDLLVEMKEHLRSPKYVINIKKIPGLDALSYDAADGLRFGALVPVRTLETWRIVFEHYRGLYQAFRVFASIQVRHRATVAGNVCRASPSAESSCPLIADAATVKAVGPEGERVVALEDFFVGPGRTVLAHNEILTEFNVPSPPPHTGKEYIKHGRRKAMELATVGVAVTVTLDGDVCRDIRVVLGAVAPTAIRAREAEDLLRGKRVEEATVRKAAAAAQAVAHPIDDVRASAAYRKEMVRVLTGRAIHSAVERAGKA